MGSPPDLQRTLVQAWTRRGMLAWLLWPLSLLYRVLVCIRQWLYSIGLLRSYRAAVPVIVVGNVVAGGSGKTPVVMAVVNHLRKRGLHPGVVSRGYGRKTTDCREVYADSPPAHVGDEPALIKRIVSAVLQIPVFVASRRAEAVSALLAAYPKTDVIVCDDGLQHLAMQRDIDICVFDDRGIGNGFLLPAGPLREPWPRQVDLVLHTGEHPAFPDGFRSRRVLHDYAVRSDGSRVALQELAQNLEQPLAAIAAIAQPEAFFAMLRASGLTLAKTVALPDHYYFYSNIGIFDEGYTVICTEKDAVKLWPRHNQVLAVPLDFIPEPGFLNALDQLLSRGGAKLSSPHGHTTS